MGDLRMKKGRTGHKKTPAGMALTLLLAFLCTAALLFSGRPAEAKEAGKNSLRLDSEVEGASFTLYRAAEKRDYGTFALTDDFAAAGTEVNDLSTDGLASLGTVLSAYIAMNHPQPVSTLTIRNGTCQWSGLADGLYIAVGSLIIRNGKLLEFPPTVVYLPFMDNGTMTMDVDGEVKSPVDVPQSSEYHVRKKWKDGNSAGRPDHVKVSLIQQGVSGSKIYGTCILSRANQWNYTWTDLPAGYLYEAIENDVPQGYTQSLRKDGASTRITNTNPSSGPGDNATPSGKISGKLPQTGQLWWPVPVLAAAGLFCLLVGFWKKVRHEEKL